MIYQITSVDTLFDNEFRNNDDLKNDLAKKYKYVGYFIEEKMVAYLCYYDFETECEIHYLVTDNGYLNKGYATQLLNYLFAKKYYRYFLEVNENNKKAVSLYLKNGFEIIAKRNNYYPDGDALIMQKAGD